MKPIKRPLKAGRSVRSWSCWWGSRHGKVSRNTPAPLTTATKEGDEAVAGLAQAQARYRVLQKELVRVRVRIQWVAVTLALC